MGLIHKIEHRFEEAVLIFLIIAALLEFFTIIPADLDFLKDIISWITVCYLVYKVSPTRLLFNNKHHVMDVFIIIAYSMFVAKNLTQLVLSGGVPTLFRPLFEFIYNNFNMLETFGLLIGGIIIALASLYLAKVMKIYRPSLIDFIKVKRKNKFVDFIEKYFIILLFLYAFFIIVFNLIIEWLAWIFDTPLIIFAISFYLFIIVRHHKKFKADNLIFKIGNYGEDFYKKAILLFHNKNTIFLALGGLLVLHTLTDVASYFIPYIFNTESFYFEGFDPEHSSLLSMFVTQFSTSVFSNIALVIIYLANYIAILFFLIFPGILWYYIFTNRKIHFRDWIRIPLFAAILITLLLPMFKIIPLNHRDFAGVDFQTTTIEGSISILREFLTAEQSILITLAITLVFSCILFLLHKKHVIKQNIDKLMIIGSIIFLGYYLALYLFEISKFFVSGVKFFSQFNIISSVMLVIFGVISVSFYIVAGWYFLHKIFEIEKHYKN